MNSLYDGPERRSVTPLEFPSVAEPHIEQPEEMIQPVEPVVDEESRAEEQERLITQRIAAARSETREETAAEYEERMRADLSVERSAIAHALTNFAQARVRYFADVEHEVVRLALAIAERILQREVAMDPTLLAGVVHVALDKLSAREGVVLRVPVKDVEMWQKATKTAGLTVQGDVLLDAGELELDATGGVAELGVRAQLEEIERGFFDLLAKRPA